ncbi:MAG: GYD domain-containing protein [Dehalococcoidia bacterium]|jgi:uncharacterized protein with GYD domain|nr:GYD domain-containing protein [Dehalococcoidia bacterium]
MLFFLLANLTDDGLQACVENPDAFAEACDSVDVPGAQLLARYATLGQYDFIVMVEADSAQTMSRLSVVLGANGHVHVESMQAITAHLMSQAEEDLIKGETRKSPEPTEAAG